MRVGGWVKEREIKVIKQNGAEKRTRYFAYTLPYGLLARVSVCFVCVSLIITINEVT